MPNPIDESLAWVQADLANLPNGTTRSTAFPAPSLSHLHVQVAWDGTPTDGDNREDATIRLTVWAPKGQKSAAIDAAGGLRARLLQAGTSAMYRVDRGAGRLPGDDPDTGLPFCTFTLQPVFLPAT